MEKMQLYLFATICLILFNNSLVNIKQVKLLQMQNVLVFSNSWHVGNGPNLG